MKNLLSLLYILTALVEIYGADYCLYCKKAEYLLKQNNIAYEKHDFGNDRAKINAFFKKNNYQSLPQIFINKKHIGGYAELKNLFDSGKLDEIIK